MEGKTRGDEAVTREMKLGYGIGDFGANLLFQSVTLYLLFYFTDILAIPAATAGTIFLAAKLWDAVTDPVMGNISDRTRSRFGAKRIYLLIGAVPLGLSFFLLFYGPDLTGSAAVLYSLLVFIFFCTMYTVVNIPYGSLTAVMSRDSQVRAEITGYRMAFALLGTLVVAGVTKPVVGLFTSQALGFRMVGLFFGAAAAVFTLITFFSTAERLKEDRDPASSLKRDLAGVVKNRPFLVLTAATLLQYIALGVIASMVNYFFKYVLPMEYFIPLAFLCLFVTAIAVMPLWVYLSKKFGKIAVFDLGMIILAAALILLYFIRSANIPVLIPVLVLAGVGLSTVYLSPWSMVPDTVEYSEWKLGSRREGTLYGVFYFAQKLAVALAGFICGRGLSVSGYVPNAVQSPGAEQGIRMLMVFVPVIIIAAALLVIRFYTIKAGFHEQMLREIEAGRIAETEEV